MVIEMHSFLVCHNFSFFSHLSFILNKIGSVDFQTQGLHGFSLAEVCALVVGAGEDSFI